VRFSTCRDYLARAIGLGFREVEVVGPSSPIACRSGAWAYAWQSLDAASAIGPADDIIRVEPEGEPAPSRPAQRRADRPTRARSQRAPATPTTPTPTVLIAGPPEGSPSSPLAGLAGLIAEGESLQEALADARARAGRLAAALRKRRGRDRLVRATLASLRRLKLEEAAD